MAHARPALALLLACAASCSRGKLDAAIPDVGVTPAALSFAGVYLTGSVKQSVTLSNAGSGPDTVAATIDPQGGAFSIAQASVPLAPGASLPLAVTFSPAAAGPTSALLHLRWSAGQATVALSGDGLAWPACEPAGPCATAAFDPASGTCQQTALPDGDACDAGDPCLVQTACAAGRCLGRLDTCDDGDACTLDYCLPGQGCQHVDQSDKCATSDPCQVGRCDPASGCATSPAPDGTPCGTEDACRTATACLAGRCVGLAVPDGTPCRLWWAPCVADAACKSGRCDSPTADVYTPGQLLWSTTGNWVLGRPPVGADGTTYSPVFVADDGGWSLVLTALDACGRTRWAAPVRPGPETTDDGAPITEAQAVRTAGGILVTDDQADLADYDPATGAQIWESFLPAALDGDAGFSAYSGAIGTNLAVSNQGSLAMGLVGPHSVLASGPGGDPSVTGLASFSIPQPLDGFSDGEVFFDAQGNSYATLQYNEGLLDAPDPPADGGISLTSSFDPAGNLRFSFWGPAGDLKQYFVVLAVGTDFFVGSGGYLGTGPFTIEGYSLSGQRLWRTEMTGGLAVRGAAIDAAGTTYVGAEDDCRPGDCSHMDGYLAAVGKDGTLRWKTVLPDSEYPVSGPALGDGDLVYVVTGKADMAAIDDGGIGVLDNSIVALDTRTGTVVWRNSIGQGQSTVVAALSVTSAGTLVANWYFNGTLSAYFLGPHKPSVDAPWPEEGGGDRNANSPRAAQAP